MFIYKLKIWGDLSWTHECVTFKCKIMGIAFLIYEFSPCS